MATNAVCDAVWIWSFEDRQGVLVARYLTAKVWHECNESDGSLDCLRYVLDTIWTFIRDVVQDVRQIVERRCLVSDAHRLPEALKHLLNVTGRGEVSGISGGNP